MRSKSAGRRRAPPPSRGNRGILIGALLLLAGAVGALTIERMPSGPAPVPSPSRPVATLSPVPSDSPPPSAAPSDSPSPSPSPASAILEAEMPTQIAGVPLTVTSAVGASALGRAPATRALDAAATKLGKTAGSLELAYGSDQSGSVTDTVLAFRINGVTAAVLEPVILNAWLSVGAPGVTVSDETLSGQAVRHVSYAGQGPDEWVVTHGDAVFVIETADKAIATSTIGSLRPVPAAAPTGSLAPTAGPPSPSPAASASP